MALALKVNESLDPPEPLDIFVLFLELGILGDEKGDSFIDVSFLEEFVEFFLEPDVQCLELSNQVSNQSELKRMYGNVLEDQCTSRGVSSLLQQSTRFRPWNLRRRIRSQ